MYNDGSVRRFRVSWVDNLRYSMLIERTDDDDEKNGVPLYVKVIAALKASGLGHCVSGLTERNFDYVTTEWLSAAP